MALFIKVYAVALITFLLVDAIWLAVVARGFYRKHLGFLLADQPNWWAAIAFYGLFLAGVVVFAILPAISMGSLWKALALGGFFGLVTYATYDLTNQATVKNWPWMVTVVDLVWGTVLCSTVSCVGYIAGRWLESS